MFNQSTKPTHSFRIPPTAVALVLALLVVLSASLEVVRAAATIRYGQPVKGTLAAGQTTDFTFEGASGDRIMISMAATGGDLDPSLSLIDPAGKLIGQNDSNGKYSAQIQGLVLPATGTYTVKALNTGAGSGEFSLIVLHETPKGILLFDEKASDSASGKEFYKLSQPLRKTDITYRLINTLPGVSAQATRDVVTQAFKAWSDVVALRFTEVSSNTADFQIQFSPIDGQYNILGEACPPSSPCAGEIKFDSGETWTLGAPRSERDISLLGVCTHEFGHALGLLHSDNPSALMYYAYSAYNIKPSPDDVTGVQRLYAATARRDASSPTSIPGTVPGINKPIVQGTLDNRQFTQFWDFDVEAGDTVTVTMKRASGNLDSLIVLLDANNNILAYDDDSDGRYDASLRAIRLPQKGTYTIAATRYDQAQGFTTGNYTLSIEYNVPAPANNNPVGGATAVPLPGAAGNGTVRVSPGQANSMTQLPSLDSVLESDFVDELAPNQQSRRATVNRTQSYVWPLTWCARDNATLQTNLSQIRVTFAVNGMAVDPRSVTQTAPHTLNGLSCADYVVVFSEWSGSTVTLTRTLTLANNVFDGSNVYGAGSYVYQVETQVQ